MEGHSNRLRSGFAWAIEASSACSRSVVRVKWLGWRSLRCNTTPPDFKLIEKGGRSSATRRPGTSGHPAAHALALAITAPPAWAQALTHDPTPARPAGRHAAAPLVSAPARERVERLQTACAWHTAQPTRPSATSPCPVVCARISRRRYAASSSVHSMSVPGLGPRVTAPSQAEDATPATPVCQARNTWGFHQLSGVEKTRRGCYREKIP